MRSSGRSRRTRQNVISRWSRSLTVSNSVGALGEQHGEAAGERLDVVPVLGQERDDALGEGRLAAVVGERRLHAAHRPT
jgi:hypothetical protein